MATETITSTRIRVPVGALRWLEVNWHYLAALADKSLESPIIKAAAREYEKKFNRDLIRDISGLTRKTS
jgi:hypothetical protein